MQIWHSGGVEGQVDLDQVAGLIARHAVAWREAGLAVGPVSWRDAGGAWPYLLREDRRQVAGADSSRCCRQQGRPGGRLVVFRGGWADLEYWSGRPCDEPVIEVPGWDDRMDLFQYRATAPAVCRSFRTGAFTRLSASVPPWPAAMLTRRSAGIAHADGPCSATDAMHRTCRSARSEASGVSSDEACRLSRVSAERRYGPSDASSCRDECV